MSRPPVTPSAPPLTVALHLVISARVDGPSRPGLLAALSDTASHAERSEPITRLAQRSVMPLAPMAPELGRYAGRTMTVGQAGPGGLATVLTMPRVIPMTRTHSEHDVRQDSGQDPSPDDAA